MRSHKNRLSQFWQELKRRNVIREIIVYAATTFAIIDLLSNIDVPIGLREWTLAFAIVILSIGFIVAVIVSLIYDIHPEGGLVVDSIFHLTFAHIANIYRIKSSYSKVH